MDPETQRWAWGIAVMVMVALVGAVYGGMLYQQRRSAANIHRLRHVVQAIIIQLAVHGIVVKTDDED